MDIISSIAIISLAALVHASFQLSVSVLTLLSGHAIGSKRSHSKLLRMTTGFVLGVGIMTILLLAFACFISINIFGKNIPHIIWMAACGLLVGVAISIWLFYYRREKGTCLWIPRSMADYLNERTKSTDLGAEAFGLGLSSVIGEILFIIAPISISALVIIDLPAPWQLASIFIYTLISMLSLIIVWVLVGGGHTLGKVQKWREDNKYFMQFAAGTGLIVLAIFIYVNVVLNSTAGLV